MNLEGDDGTRPAHGTLLTARWVDGRIRILLERVRKRDELWEAWSPLGFRDYDSWDAIPEEDIRTLGAGVLANLEASMTATK